MEGEREKAMGGFLFFLVFFLFILIFSWGYKNN